MIGAELQSAEKSAQKPSFTPANASILQRKCDGCREKEKILQRSAVGSAPKTMLPIVQEVLRPPRQLTDTATRAFMEPRFGHDFSQIPVHSKSLAGIQAKLTVNTSGDIYEQEADRVSHEVMRMPPGVQSSMQPNPAIANKVGSAAGHVQREAESPDEQGDCSGWERDCESLCIKAAKQYWLDIGVSPPPLAEGPVECVRPFIGPDGKPRAGMCLLTYKNGVIVTVARTDIGKNLEVWQTKSNDQTKSHDYSGPVCKYRYYCTKQQNTLVLKKKACYDPRTEKPPKETEQESSPPAAIQRSSTHESSAPLASPMVQDVLSSPGQALDPATSRFMENRFGHDFSGVRVHTDNRAAESARSVNALAYTVGRDVVFGAGQYAPRSFSGRRLLAHELMHVVQQAGATKSSLNIQREPDKKPKRPDVVVIGEDWKGSEELALVLAPGAFVIRVKSMREVVMKLAKVNFPVGTLYIITHSAPTGELQFGTAEGTIKPADIAVKLKGALSTDNAPEVVDFRGCSVGTSPKAMDQIGAALGAKSVIAGDCFAVIDRSKSVSINDKAITRASEVTEKAADDDRNKKRRDLFVDLLRKNADTFGGAKKCIVNPGENGYFAAGGHFVALWFNRDDTASWVPGKSICYKDVAPETVDSSKAIAASDHCRLIKVEEKAKSKD